VSILSLTTYATFFILLLMGETTMIYTNISIDADTLHGSKELPRKMSMSKLIRHMIKAHSYDAKQWAAYRLTAEGKECLEFLRPLRERLASKE